VLLPELRRPCTQVSMASYTEAVAMEVDHDNPMGSTRNSARRASSSGTSVSRNDDPIKLARETLESVIKTVELLEGCVKEHIRVRWVRRVEGFRQWSKRQETLMTKETRNIIACYGCA